MVSNIYRTMRNFRPRKLPLRLLVSSLVLAGSTLGQTPAGTTPSLAQGQNHVTRSGPNRENGNSSQSALDAVRVFYTYITKYQPLGLPQGRAKKDLWPLLSKRLVRELDALQSCDDDYYRRYGDYLRANQFKPVTPWLEHGLFSGPNEAAIPSADGTLATAKGIATALARRAKADKTLLALHGMRHFLLRGLLPFWRA